MVGCSTCNRRVASSWAATSTCNSVKVTRSCIPTSVAVCRAARWLLYDMMERNSSSHGISILQWWGQVA